MSFLVKSAILVLEVKRVSVERYLCSLLNYSSETELNLVRNYKGNVRTLTVE